MGGGPSVSRREAPAVLSSPSGARDDETWLDSLQQDVKLAEPPECAWVCQSLNNKARNSRNPNYRPRLTEHGRKLVWLALRNSIHGGDDANDPANSAWAPARRTPATGASLGGRPNITPGVLEPICAKYQISPQTAYHIWNGTFHKQGAQRDEATALLREFYGERGVKQKGVVGDDVITCGSGTSSPAMAAAGVGASADSGRAVHSTTAGPQMSTLHLAFADSHAEYAGL
jgi:hypothetical protein